MSRNAETSGDPRSLMWLAALVYTAFVIYGSLVPLEYRALPWDEAVARFTAIRWLELGVGSRADWVANLLLFIPLSFLWMGALSAGAGPLRTALATLALIPAATALSLGIEFTQLFFPQRTVSQNDIFAETLGGLIGVQVWWGTGGRFLVWLQSWQKTRARAALAERMAWGYLAGVLVYNVLPLDLTISLVEIFHQWREGKVNLLPFGRLPADPALALYEVVTDALIWVPLALLWRLDGTRSSRRVWAMTMAMAVMLELMQLFVYSRVSDTTDLFTAAAGAALGAWVGGRLAARDAPSSRPLAWRTWLPFALAAGWMVVLVLVFWFPFDFRTDGSFIKGRLGFVERVPFEVYYFGTEYRAITEVLHKTLFFAPLGALLAWGVTGLPYVWRSLAMAGATGSIVAFALMIELGQVLLPGKFPDTTDWLLASLGGLAGYGLARRMLRAPRHAGTARPVVAVEPLGPLRRARRPWYPLLTVAAVSLVFWGGTQAPFAPYNLRELLRQDSTWLSALLLALACYWLAVWPVWLARRRVSARMRLLQLPLGMLAYGGVVFLLLKGAVTEESLHDLAGSPVLDWAGQWEIGLRWVALSSIPGALLYLAAQSVRRWRGRRLGALHFWAVVPVLVLAYWGVVAQAATDNLVELLAAPHQLAFITLCAWLYTLFLAAAVLASPGSTPQRLARLIVLPVSLPLAALFLHLGLADVIDKYGEQFSAMQFLLSTDRQHYATQAVVWLRYGVLHVLVIAALAFIQLPYYRAASQQPYRQASHASD